MLENNNIGNMHHQEEKWQNSIEFKNMQQFSIINLKHLMTTNCMALKPDKKEKRQTPKSLNYNIYTMYNKIKALNKHTGSEKKKRKKKKTYDTVRSNVGIVVALIHFYADSKLLCLLS